MDILSQEEFRAAIESKFGLEMSDERFRSMLDRMPLDEEGNVKYADFMAQFDTRCVLKMVFLKIKKGEIKPVEENYYKFVSFENEER